MTQVNVGARSVEAFASVVGQSKLDDLRERAALLRSRMAGHALWNVNSTAAGGGVAEMLQAILPYVRGADIDARWVVLRGSPEFFLITKRLHNALHGWTGDGSSLGIAERAAYEARLRAVADDFVPLLQPGDVVLLHDPQTAGLVSPVVKAGAVAIWRCHIGDENGGEEAALGWSFLMPYLREAHAFVFSRQSYVPSFCNNGRSRVIPPSIDAFSTKNQSLAQEAIRAILGGSGLVGAASNGARPRYFSARDQTQREVARAIKRVTAQSPPSLDTPLVAQISRWDALKDPIGVLRGFVKLIEAGHPTAAHLVLAGPDVSGVADDPEGAKVFAQVIESWRCLADPIRRRVHLALLPMEDVEENAAIVNALQRHAAVVVQKSLQEGFGLTVTEAMWKGRAVVASAVGGIRDQIVDGVHGLLVRDPSDLDGFSQALAALLENPHRGRLLGENARQRVCEEFLGTRALGQYADLLLNLHNGGRPAT